MIVEALILNRDDRVDEVRRNTRQRDIHSPLVEDGERQLIVAVVHGCGLIHLPDPRDRVVIGKVRLQPGQIPEWASD